MRDRIGGKEGNCRQTANLMQPLLDHDTVSSQRLKPDSHEHGTTEQNVLFALRFASCAAFIRPWTLADLDAQS